MPLCAAAAWTLDNIRGLCPPVSRPRFYYRCTHCSAEFCMKTDPKNAGELARVAGMRVQRAARVSRALLALAPPPHTHTHPRLAPPHARGPAALAAHPPLPSWSPLLLADYELEAGATRNYEPWRDKEKAAAEAVAQREEEERGNAMKARGGRGRLPPHARAGVQLGVAGTPAVDVRASAHTPHPSTHPPQPRAAGSGEPHPGQPARDGHFERAG